MVPTGTTNFNIWSSKSGTAGILYLDDFCLTVIPASGGTLRTANPVPAVKESLSVTVYPNPAQQDIYIRLTGYNGSRVVATLVDINGRIVYQEIVATQKGTTHYRLPDVKKLSQGVYILTVRGEGMMSSTKVLIQ